jgi:hypothetical protein
LAPPLVVGFGEAARIAKEELEVSTNLDISGSFLSMMKIARMSVSVKALRSRANVPGTQMMSVQGF